MLSGPRPGSIEREIPLEAGDERADEGGEVPQVVVGRGGCDVARSDLDGRLDHGVGPLDPATHGALVRHVEEAGVDEPGHVAVQRGLRDVAQFVFELLGGELTADERLHDAEPHRVQERVGNRAVIRHAGHRS